MEKLQNGKNSISLPHRLIVKMESNTKCENMVLGKLWLIIQMWVRVIMSRCQRIHQIPALWGTWHIVPWNFTCKINSNWLEYRHFLMNWKSAKRHRIKSYSHRCTSHNRAVFTETLVLGSTFSKEVFMHRWGRSTRQDFNSISQGNEMEGICQYPLEPGIFKWT